MAKTTKPKRKSTAVNKITTMLQATAMSKDELTSITNLAETGNVVDTIDNEREIEKIHDELEAESKELSLDTVPIYESTALEINKKLSDELEECKTRYANLLEENDTLQKKMEELQKSQTTSDKSDSLSEKYAALSKDYLDLQDKYETLYVKYAREIEDSKIQLADAEKNYRMYDENESNYKIEIKKLRAEIRNLELALEEKPEAQNRLAQNLQGGVPGSSRPSQSQRPSSQQSIPLPQFKKRIQAPTNGYTSWN